MPGRSLADKAGSPPSRRSAQPLPGSRPSAECPTRSSNLAASRRRGRRRRAALRPSRGRVDRCRVSGALRPRRRCRLPASALRPRAQATQAPAASTPPTRARHRVRMAHATPHSESVRDRGDTIGAGATSARWPSPLSPISPLPRESAFLRHQFGRTSSHCKGRSSSKKASSNDRDRVKRTAPAARRKPGRVGMPRGAAFGHDRSNAAHDRKWADAPVNGGTTVRRALPGPKGLR